MEGVRLSPGNFHHPGAGFLPIVAGVILILLGLVVLVESFFQKNNESPLWVASEWSGPLLTMGILAVFAVTLRWLGFFLSATFTMALLFHKFGLKRWSIIMGASILTSFLCYLLFGVILGNEFPKGLFGLF